MDVDADRLEDKSKAKMKPKAATSGPMFSLKKWNAVAMWQWDVECDTCAICRVQVMGKLSHSNESMRPLFQLMPIPV